MLAGIVAAMMELRGALQPVELETPFVSSALEPAIAAALQEAEPLLTDEYSEERASHWRR
jgi:hypothetical protein